MKKNVGLKSFWVISVLALFGTLQLAQAQLNSWVPTGAGDWNTPGNWSLGVVPTTSNPNNIDNGGHATISGTVPAFTQIRVGDIQLGGPGNDPNSTGTLTHSAGVNNMSSWIGVARGGQNVQGTFNMSGGTLNVNSGARFYVAGENSIGGAANTVGHYNQSGGTLNVSGQTRWGEGGVGTANINITGGTLNTAQLLAGNGNATANITHSGGRVNASSWFTLIGSGGNDTYTLSNAAQLNVNSEMTVGENGGGGTATMNVNGQARVNSGGAFMAIGRNSGSVGILNQNGADTLVRNPNVSLGLNGGSTGTYNLNAGTLSANTIGQGAGTGFFNFGDGTIRSYEVNTDTTITFNGALSTGTAGDPNATSTIDLGNLGKSGSVIWDDMIVNGDLTLGSNADVLDFWDNISKLRPIGGGNQITGEIPLINVTGTLSGQFDTVLGPGPDSRFFRLYDTGPTGIPTGTSADALQLNSGFVDYRADGVYFVYKISGTVPEPGTAGLVLLGALMVKGARSFRRQKYARSL